MFIPIPSFRFSYPVHMLWNQKQTQCAYSGAKLPHSKTWQPPQIGFSCHWAASIGILWTGKRKLPYGTQFGNRCPTADFSSFSWSEFRKSFPLGFPGGVLEKLASGPFVSAHCSPRQQSSSPERRAFFSCTVEMATLGSLASLNGTTDKNDYFIYIFFTTLISPLFN